MSDREDWDLLQLYARDGSHRAFAELTARYTRFVYTIAYRRTRDPHLAEDVTQAVFIVLARRAESLPQAVSIPGWLHRTTVFTAVSALRSENRRRRHELVAAERARQETGDRNEICGATAALDADERAELQHAIGQLPLRDREVLNLHFFQDCRVREVGSRLGISREAAAKRLGRAVRRLRVTVAQKESAVVVSALLLVTLALLAQAGPDVTGSAFTALGGASAIALGIIALAAIARITAAGPRLAVIRTLPQRLSPRRKRAGLALAALLLIACWLGLSLRPAAAPQRSAASRTLTAAPHVTLVSEGDHFLEKNLVVAASTRRISPDAYDPAAEDPETIVIFDGVVPPVVPDTGRFIWINAVPPGRGIHVRGEVGIGQLGALTRIVGWRGEHPILQGLELSAIRIAGQLALELPPRAQVLADGSQGPLIILDQDERSTHLVIAFSPRESTWPLHDSYGKFLKQAIEHLSAEPALAHAIQAIRLASAHSLLPAG